MIQERKMQAFHIHYRNTQGTLMRILTAVSRRALDLTYVKAEAEPNEQIYKVTLLLDVNPKQVGQLRRDWYAIVDVTEVRLASSESAADHASAWPGATPQQPSSATPRPTDETVRAARA
jgi:acetolactate synthase small subunit